MIGCNFDQSYIDERMTISQQTQIADLPLGPEVKFLGSASHGLIALEKPAGLMSHPNRDGDKGRCLLAADYNYEDEVYTWKAVDRGRRAWLLNRLDSPTSGVLLLALDERIVPVIRELFAAHKVRKTYYALVKNRLSLDSGCWKDVLTRDAYRTAKVAKLESGGFAQTYYQVMAKSDGNSPLSLIKLMPVTGRTHQLRIQCNYHRHPIVGDRTHGDFKFNRRIASLSGEKRMMLHSAEIDLSYRVQGKECKFNVRSELPQAFAKLLRSFGYSQSERAGH